MKNKKLFLGIYIILLFILFISLTILAILGKKERVGYLSEFKINVDKTLELNYINIEEIKELFGSKFDYDSITNYLLTNESITIYSYDFRIKYYDKIFRNSDIYGVYPNLNNLPEYIKIVKMDDNKGSPFGNLASTKILDIEKIDNINYVLKLKNKLILIYIILLIILLTFICIIYINNIYKLLININIILTKNKILVSKICFIIIAVLIVSMIVLSLLGRRERFGYLSEFNINVYKTLELNYITNNEEMKNLFYNRFNDSSITNYVLTNESITNYSYDFRIKYYDKIFRNSDIYGVYPNLNNLPEYIKIANMSDNTGTPFGNLISTKILDIEKIDNINYVLKLKNNLILVCIILLIILLLYNICFIYRNNVYKIFIKIKNFLIKELFSNSKKYAISFSILFFIVMSISEINLFVKEVNKEFVHNPVYHPYYFFQTSIYLNPTMMKDGYNFNNRIVMNPYRKNIKDNYHIRIDEYADNHVLGHIYALLKTGKNIKELRSHNFISFRGAFNADTNIGIASKEDFNTPTLYSSLPLLITKITYSLMPIKFIDSYQTELEASYKLQNIKIFFMLIHILLWTILIYIVAVKFNFLYAFVLGISIFCFPGSSAFTSHLYNTTNLIALFPIYIFIFYNPNYNLKKQTLFFIGLSILIFFQWSLVHYHSIVFQLPSILLTLFFYNYYFQIKENNNITNMEIFISHIKYIWQYIFIVIISFLITILVIFLTYKEQVELQPENKEIIYKNIFERSRGYATKLSLALIDPDFEKKDPKIYYPMYSFENFKKHNRIVYSQYFDYPSIYPLWRLEQFLPFNISNFMYEKLPNYFTLNHLSAIILILNLCIILKKNNYKLLIPFLLFIAQFVWFAIYSNITPRLASHQHVYAHMLNQYFVSFMLLYMAYLIIGLFSDRKTN